MKSVHAQHALTDIFMLHFNVDENCFWENASRAKTVFPNWPKAYDGWILTFGIKTPANLTRLLIPKLIVSMLMS